MTINATIDNATPAGRARGTGPLAALNFFMADVQAGIGPFLGVFLAAHNWQSGAIGTVMTIGGIAGMLLAAPAGAFVDTTTRKRLLVIVLGICTVFASLVILFEQAFWVVALSQVATAIAGSAIGPAINAMTLGIVRQAGFARQNAINQAFNHAGNVAGAALSGYLGWQYGLVAVFWLSVVFAVFAIASTVMIPGDAIDNDAARGSHTGEGEKARGFHILFQSRPLVILAVSLLFFHLGNGAMLPLFGLAVVAGEKTDPASFVALTIIVAQATMIVASLLALKLEERHSQWFVLLISFLALPVRGAIACGFVTWWGVYPVQILDGVGAGLQSVAVPALVARILNGTGRVNVGLGAIMTVQGIGASLSPALGGWLAQGFGYPTAFAILGSVSVISLVLWGFSSKTIHAAEANPD